jgi:hypothetical protein
MTTFYRLRFETTPTWGTRVPYLYPQELCGPVILPGTGFHFRRLLRFAGLRWRYLNRLHTGFTASLNWTWSSRIASGRTHRQCCLQHLFYCCVTSPRTISPNRSIAMGCTRHVSWHLLYCCLRALPSNGRFSASTVLNDIAFADMWCQCIIFVSYLWRCPHLHYIT